MYKKPLYTKSLITADRLREGETIEAKVTRILENKEPIKDGSPLIYTERKDGINPAYNIRTDRFEIATEAMDKVHRSKEAKRDEIVKPPKKEDAKVIEINKDGGAESTDGKVENQSK